MNEIKIYSVACFLGGLMRIIGSFVSLDAANEYLDILYIATDLCLILGLIGFYIAYREKLFWLGHCGFATVISGLSFIAGPETDIFDISVYQIGTPVVGLGILLLSASLLRNKICGLWAPVLLASAVIVGLSATIISSSILFIATGVLFGIGFILLGICTWQTS